MSLEDWGWDENWAAEFGPDQSKGWEPARIINQQRGLLGVIAPDGEKSARLPGALQHAASGAGELPAVGDWIAGEAVPGERTLLVRRVLSRRTKLSRRAAGEAEVEQVIAANVDTTLVTAALNMEFNARRLERFLAVARDSGAEAIVVLNKLDLCVDPRPCMEEANKIASGAPIVSLSAKTGQGIEALGRWIRAGKTAACIGPSGVGKSTLINRLLGGNILRTEETRASDQRGRHATTHRQLFLLPGGGMIVDTPGMRELRFWDAERGTAETFPEIEALAPTCRFTDCRHNSEPGCAVKAAVDAGTLEKARLAAWRKLQEESRARKARSKEKR